MDLRKRSSPRVQLNLNVRGMSNSATLTINERCAELRQAGREVFRLGLGQSPFPVPASVTSALQAHAHEKDYLPVKGLPQLRQAIVDHYERAEGLKYSVDNILVGPGTKELMFIVQLVYYGDLVIPTPSWVSYAPQAHIIGRHLRWIPTEPRNGLAVTPEALKELCRQDPERPRLLILNYPGNPTGSTYEVEQLEAIAKVARRYRVLLLSDEIYGGLHFEGKHVSIARFYPEGTIISNGLSKWCGAGGWRLGAFVFPESLQWLLQSMAAVASETFTSTSAPVQYAAVRAFQGGEDIEQYLRHCRRILKALAYYSWERLRAAGGEVIEPKGAFYLFPNFDGLRERLRARGIDSGEQLCRKALDEAGVAMLPGTVFGRPVQELSARIALVDFDGERALRAVAELGDDESVNEVFLREHCANVVTAVDRLCDWLQ